MRKSQKTASSKSEALVEAILVKKPGLSKPNKAFFISLITLFLSMRGRHNFSGMGRYGQYCEQSYRNHFEKTFNFMWFNEHLVKDHLSKDLIIAFDPSYIPKSGKKTPHRDNFWSGCLGKSVKGLEISGLAVVDIKNNTALSLEAVQTPDKESLLSKGQSRVEHYANVIIERQDWLRKYSLYCVVDGYFTKKTFVDNIMEFTGFEIVGKLRKDANLKYYYIGPKRKGRGRPKKYGKKINYDKLDKRQFTKCYEDKNVIIYQAIVYCLCLKRKIKICYIQFKDEQGNLTNRYCLLYSTDINLEGDLIYKYYKARFQIEFLFRDAKQFCGLTHCQARSEAKLHFHFNTALTAVNVAKVTHHLNQKIEDRNAFSLSDIKTVYFNELMLNLFISNFEIDLSLQKNQMAIENMIAFGKIAA